MAATAAHVALTPQTAGIYHVPNISTESCSIASELLQKNHDKHHMYFNQSGFHNHIAHHLLTIFALGATPSQIQRAYDTNASYQRPHFPVEQRNVQSMHDAREFKRFLGNERYFHDYEIFFRTQIMAAENDGWQHVVQEHVFARTEHADAMLTRMYAGFLHPLIHLGFGTEFQQPAIVVEALAQAAIHDNWTADYLLSAEKKAASSASADPSSQPRSKSKSLVQLIHECRVNDKLRTSPRWSDGNKVRDGVLKRAPDEMIELASQWTVAPEELERKTAEMINASVYFTAGAQHPPNQVKFDFFYIHSLNCGIFFSAFLKQDWLKTEDKCRLLEWKGRFDLAMYVSRGSPEPLMDEIRNYREKKPGEGWEEIFQRVDTLGDDGHASKLVRALAHGEQVCEKYKGEGDNVFPIQGHMWLKTGHMAIDSVEGGGSNWVRNAGFDEAWEMIPERN